MALTTYGLITAGISPRRTSERANIAVSAATAISQQATRPTPPPIAAPLTRAMVGWGSR